MKKGKRMKGKMMCGFKVCKIGNHCFFLTFPFKLNWLHVLFLMQLPHGHIMCQSAQLQGK
jgi:hypothetical protein